MARDRAERTCQIDVAGVVTVLQVLAGMEHLLGAGRRGLERAVDQGGSVVAVADGKEIWKLNTKEKYHFHQNFFGVGGAVFDLQSNPLKGMVVKLEGNAGGKFYSQLTVSGTAQAYGQSGFEFALGSKPVDSTGGLTVQLLDQAGLPLSDNLYIDLSKDCSKNLVLVRFVKNP